MASKDSHSLAGMVHGPTIKPLFRQDRNQLLGFHLSSFCVIFGIDICKGIATLLSLSKVELRYYGLVAVKSRERGCNIYLGFFWSNNT